MARPKRQGDWVPVTTRMDAGAAKRLRVAAAKRGITMGRLLDELVLAHLPPVDAAAPRKRAAPEPTSTSTYSVETLRREMKRHGLNQSDLARSLGISPRAVSEWFERGSVPDQRQAAIRRVFMEAERAAKLKS